MAGVVFATGKTGTEFQVDESGNVIAEGVVGGYTGEVEVAGSEEAVLVLTFKGGILISVAEAD